MIDMMLLAFSLPVVFQAIFVFIETVVHFRCRHDPDWPEVDTDAYSCVVLIPAHNEELVISQTLNGLAKRLGKNDRILVVADNCSDETARIARESRAEVIERNDEENRGKGFALDYGIRHLQQTQEPEILVVLDADCRISEGAIEALKSHVVRTGMPAQALDLMHAPPNPDFYQKIAAFAWFFRIAVRFVGDRCLGLPVMIMGTGMAFRFEDAARLNLASGDIVEDMKMTLDLATRKKYPELLYDVKVESEFPQDSTAQDQQKTRWEHGHLELILHVLPKHFFQALLQRDIKMLGLILSMGVLPMTLLAAAIVGLFFASSVVAALGGGQVSLFTNGVAALLFGGAIFLAWLGGGKQILTFRDLMQLPAYVLRKIPLYRRFLSDRETRWIRTERK